MHMQYHTAPKEQQLWKASCITGCLGQIIGKKLLCNSVEASAACRTVKQLLRSVYTMLIRYLWCEYARSLLIELIKSKDAVHTTYEYARIDA